MYDDTLILILAISTYSCALLCAVLPHRECAECNNPSLWPGYSLLAGELCISLYSNLVSPIWARWVVYPYIGGAVLDKPESWNYNHVIISSHKCVIRLAFYGFNYPALSAPNGGPKSGKTAVSQVNAQLWAPNLPQTWVRLVLPFCVQYCHRAEQSTTICLLTGHNQQFSATWCIATCGMSVPSLYMQSLIT